MPPRKRRISYHGEEDSKESKERTTYVQEIPVGSDKGMKAAAGSLPTTPTASERRLTARQASRQEALASQAGGAEGRDPGTAPIRSSSRVVKRPKRDFSPPESPVKKSGKASNPKSSAGVVTTPETKQKRQWELWSVEDKNTFFEGLMEYGKDFDAIHSLLVVKAKKKGSSQTVIKNKEQVRHFYYRTWHKISKFIEPIQILPDNGLKKDAIELYGLINYGAMRRKIHGGMQDKNWQKLNSLVYTGYTTVKVQGKNLRIRTPVCQALKRLHNLEEPKKDQTAKVPDSVQIELLPKNNMAWAQVQNLAQNPRLRIALKTKRRLGSVISYLEKKWQPHRLKLKDKMDIKEDPIKELRVFPHRASVMTPITMEAAEEPKMNFSLNSFIETMTTQSSASSKSKKGNAYGDKPETACLENSPPSTDLAVITNKAVVKSNVDCPKSNATSAEIEQYLLESTVPFSKTQSVTNSVTVIPDSIALPCSPACTASSITPLKSEVSAMDEDENAMFPDNPLSIEAVPSVSSSVRNSIVESVMDNQDFVNVIDDNVPKASPDCSANEKDRGIIVTDSSQNDRDRYYEEIMKSGWNQNMAETVSVAELYMLFGKDGIIRFEYEWCSKRLVPGEECNILKNLTNMLRRLVNLATIEFTDFSKTPNANSPCHVCGTMGRTKSRERGGYKGLGRSPTTCKTVSGVSKNLKDASTQTKPLPVLVNKDNSTVWNDPVFRVPISSPSVLEQRAVFSRTMTDKQLVQHINPKFSKQPMRPRRLKSVSRRPSNFQQRTILPKGQMVTILPFVSDQGQCHPITRTNIPSGIIQPNQTFIGHPMRVGLTTTGSITASSGHSIIQSVEQMAANQHLQYPLVDPLGSPDVGLSPQSVAAGNQALLSIPSQIDLLSASTVTVPVITTSTITTTAATSCQRLSTTISSVSPPNISSLLDVSMSSLPPAPADVDKFIDYSIETSSSNMFCDLIDQVKIGSDNGLGPVTVGSETGLTTPPLQSNSGHNQVSTPPSSPPIRSLFKMSSLGSESQWLNGVATDFSLTSFLESPMKNDTDSQNFQTVSHASISFPPATLFSENSRDSMTGTKLEVSFLLHCDNICTFCMSVSSLDWLKLLLS
ncbi:hypothetical protein CHS0354_042058 [Potamilus streckersoni]|uniref:SANT domain-containing protein n=1 Tax=Potamilus streckersoni TaxID=2493646 RepID=A0AAE0TAH2_9BIVA|nr:hypothetical protein CHS0354_042058 [Potamilus streckersoni]